MNAKSDSTPMLRQGLAGYLRAVAAAVDVPLEATSFEVSDTATAYLALAREWSGQPGRDLMLVWSEHNGWVLAVETMPTEAPVVVAYLGGDDPVPRPAVVARFVSDVVDHRRADRLVPAFPTVDNRDGLADRLSRYSEDPA